MIASKLVTDKAGFHLGKYGTCINLRISLGSHGSLDYEVYSNDQINPRAYLTVRIVTCEVDNFYKAICVNFNGL